jgi:hypothetical protein
MIKGEVEVGRVYRNIKNQKYYRVDGIGKYTEEPMVLETMVFYKALYQDNQPFWVRPYWLFKEKFEECSNIDCV